MRSRCESWWGRMEKPDYDNPATEEHWCNEQRQVVAEYLRSESIEHGEIGEWPAWHVAPYASIWITESLRYPGAIGWWIICGDLPTSHIAAAVIEPPQHPRKAMRAFAQHWLDQVDAWEHSRDHESIRVNPPHSREELAPLLKSRANLLFEWANDDMLWADERYQ